MQETIQARASVPAVRARGPAKPRILSFGQERLWYLNQLAPESAAYNMPYLLRLEGRLDTAALASAFRAVVERHEVLRTVVLPVKGRPRPVLLRNWNLDFTLSDLRTVSFSTREEQAARLVHESAGKPFDLGRDVLLRVLLIHVEDEHWILLHTSHHMVFEGGSLGAFYADLAAAYARALSGADPTLGALPLQFADFASWQREQLTAERLSVLNAYWSRELQGTPVLSLPLDHDRPAIHTQRGRRTYFSIDSELLGRAKEFFTSRKTSAYRGLLAVFAVLLRLRSGQSDFSIGSPFAPRCSGVQEVIGFFVNTVALRFRFERSLTFGMLLERANRTVRDAIAHADLPFDRMVEVAEIARDGSRPPLFQVNFRAPKEPYPSWQAPGIRSGIAHYSDNGTAKFDLALEIESLTGAACYVEYCSDLFREETVQGYIGDYQHLLSRLMEEPDRLIDDLLSDFRG